MKIIYKTGSLMEASEILRCQSLNAQGVIGSGVAKIIRDKHEKVYTEYRKVYEDQGNNLNLGQVIWVDCETEVYINIIGQEFYGRDPSIRYVSYDAIRNGLREINRTVADQNIAIAFPLLGNGLGNGSWKIISEIIEEESTNFQPVVYLIDGKIPTS